MGIREKGLDHRVDERHELEHQQKVQNSKDNQPLDIKAPDPVRRHHEGQQQRVETQQDSAQDHGAGVAENELAQGRQLTGGDHAKGVELQRLIPHALFKLVHAGGFQLRRAGKGSVIQLHEHSLPRRPLKLFDWFGDGFGHRRILVKHSLQQRRRDLRPGSFRRFFYGGGELRPADGVADIEKLLHGFGVILKIERFKGFRADSAAL